MYLCKFVKNPPTGSDVKSKGKADYCSLYGMVTLQIRSRSPNLLKSLLGHSDIPGNINLAAIHHSIWEITFRNTIMVKI